MGNPKALQRIVSRAIKRLDKAAESLSEIMDETMDENLPFGREDSRVRLLSDIREYTDYLEGSTWWRS